MSAPRNRAASVHRRLLDLARQRREELEYLLTRYALERLLYRLGASPHADQFVLKGAVLFGVWTDQPHRATRDLDLHGQGDPSPARAEAIFRDLCARPVDDDGLALDAASVRALPMREDEEYRGVRVQLTARLGQARVPLQVDIGFGDAITPVPIEVAVPALLDGPPPRMRAYPRETVVAEKYHAMVRLGIANSRMKDFYDLWTLARRFDFDGPTLTRALETTFARRRTDVPAEPPLALTPSFSTDAAKQAQWRAFATRGRLLDEPPALGAVIAALADFLMPPTRALAGRGPFRLTWPAGGPWQPGGATPPAPTNPKSSGAPSAASNSPMSQGDRGPAASPASAASG